MSSKFSEAAEELIEANQQFSAGKIKSVQHSDLRAASLAKALNELAIELGVKLQMPLQINARGEFSVVACKPDGTDPRNGCGHYGEKFASLLNRHQPRTGTSGSPSTMSPESGWCNVNHFEVENMVLEYYTDQHQSM